MTDVLIKRELLERLALQRKADGRLEMNTASAFAAGKELRALLDAPRQPEGEGLEVVAWQDAENPLYTTAERRVLHDWANNGYPIVELCRLSDHLRAIAELREECEQVKADRASCWAEFKVMTRSCLEAEKERDTLRQQRDKLAGLLREVHSAGRSRRLTVDELYRIDAALAEVKPCQESPRPVAT